VSDVFFATPDATVFIGHSILATSQPHLFGIQPTFGEYVQAHQEAQSDDTSVSMSGDTVMTSQIMKKLAGVLVCVVLLWSFAGAQGSKGYRIHSQIPESVFKSDSERALDTYERMVDRALELNKRQLDVMDLNIKEVSKQLTRVEAKLDQLLNRSLLAEYALGISHVGARKVPAVARRNDPNTPAKVQEAR
jgi:hypothetical protein